LFVCLWQGAASWARCHGRFGPPIVPYAPPSGPLSAHTRQRGEGRVRALLKLQNFTVPGNCPFCPIYNTIGIHPVMKGYWPRIKFSSRHWGRLGMQWVQLIFSFFGFWGKGKRENFFLFFIGGGGPVIHPWNGGTIMWQFIS
jgi:hypothetical protein